MNAPLNPVVRSFRLKITYGNAVLTGHLETCCVNVAKLAKQFEIEIFVCNVHGSQYNRDKLTFQVIIMHFDHCKAKLLI